MAEPIGAEASTAHIVAAATVTSKSDLERLMPRAAAANRRRNLCEEQKASSYNVIFTVFLALTRNTPRSANHAVGDSRGELRRPRSPRASMVLGAWWRASETVGQLMA
jgi:hypothetical protein